MSDKKMDMFLSDMNIWQATVDRAHDKKVPLNVLNLVSYPEARELIAYYMEQDTLRITPPTINYLDKLNGKPISYQEATARNMKKVRELYANTPLERVIMGVIYRIYYKLYIDQIHPACVSYQTGISVSKTVKELSKRYSECNAKAGKNYLGYKVDLSKYFDSVNKRTLFRALQELSTDSPIDNLVYQYYSDDRVIIHGEEVERYKSLAQGCALGCFLANYILRDVDEVLSNLNIIYYRYSDDLIMIGPDADKAIHILEKMLAEKSLELNPAKVERIKRDQWFTFLGFRFKGDKISLSADKLDRIAHEIKVTTMSYVRQKKRPATKIEISRMIKHLQGYFYMPDDEEKMYGMGPILFQTVNVEHDLRIIEDYAKDCLRAAYTNRTEIYGIGSSYAPDFAVRKGVIGKNCGRNFERTHNASFEGGDLLLECGWYSLIHMGKTYHMGKAIYNGERRKMCLGVKAAVE